MEEKIPSAERRVYGTLVAPSTGDALLRQAAKIFPRAGSLVSSLSRAGVS